MKAEARIEIAKDDIVKTFDSYPKQVFTRTEIRQIVDENREFWRLGNTTADAFINVMLQVSPLQLVKLPFPHRKRNLYVWRELGLFELLQSLDPNIYFCHYAALHLHGLTEQIPKTIYLNIEQRLSGGGGTLTQESIDRTFKGKCRVSSNVIEYEGYRICLVNGGNTNQLGVTFADPVDPASKIRLRITDVERTLIDATVRPVYSGGVAEVAKAFEIAKEHVSVNKIVAYLRKLNYTYPYHQAIGYYLERAGYSNRQLKMLSAFPNEFDFYLTYAMKEKEYVRKWKLFIPQGF